MIELIRRPFTWALLSGFALLLALVLPAALPPALFWSLVGLSCAGAAAAVWLADEGEG